MGAAEPAAGEGPGGEGAPAAAAAASRPPPAQSRGRSGFFSANVIVAIATGAILPSKSPEPRLLFQPTAPVSPSAHTPQAPACCPARFRAIWGEEIKSSKL